MLARSQLMRITGLYGATSYTLLRYDTSTDITPAMCSTLYSRHTLQLNKEPVNAYVNLVDFCRQRCRAHPLNCRKIFFQIYKVCG